MVYKRAQVSEAIIWLIATAIVVGLLVVSVYATSKLADDKTGKEESTLEIKTSYLDSVYFHSLVGIFLTKNSKGVLFGDEISLGEDTGKAREILRSIYTLKYEEEWTPSVTAILGGIR